MARDVELQGFDQLAKSLATFPTKVAPAEIQRTVAKQHIAHKFAVIQRSQFSSQFKGILRQKRGGPLRVIPDRRLRPKRIRHVYGDTFFTWRGATPTGQALPDDEAIGRAIEEDVGKSIYRPRRRRRLLIPTGDYTTASGSVRRQRVGKGKGSRLRRIRLADLPDTRVVAYKRGGRTRLVVVQKLEAGRRGKFEKLAKGTKGKSLGERERVIGVLVRKARVHRELDFFASWNALEGARRKLYRELLDRLVRHF